MQKWWLAIGLLLRIHWHLAKYDFNIQILHQYQNSISATGEPQIFKLLSQFHLWLISGWFSQIPVICTAQILKFFVFSSFSMPGTKKRGPSTEEDFQKVQNCKKSEKTVWASWWSFEDVFLAWRWVFGQTKHAQAYIVVRSPSRCSVNSKFIIPCALYSGHTLSCSRDLCWPLTSWWGDVSCLALSLMRHDDWWSWHIVLVMNSYMCILGLTQQ